MLSFNHYAYGAVIDWVYRNVAGIAPDPARPGYRNVVFAPKPAMGIDWARASVDSPFGQVAIDWRIDTADGFVADIELPFGSSGVFIAPISEGLLGRGRRPDRGCSRLAHRRAPQHRRHEPADRGRCPLTGARSGVRDRIASTRRPSR